MDRTYNAEKAIVIEKLNTLGDEERMSLFEQIRTTDRKCILQI